ncbi:uncharacterized protein LOC141613766 [Silene latifolia]|uniref:uncharacterized protein LOC141613766 n=1 Tax=Silene latifolia TaxID=37657 RepID=UPI003D7770F5
MGKKCKDPTLSASGLDMNKEKSDIYFNGMQHGEIEHILNISGFKPGVLPFRYLGIPISCKRMGIGDCTRLVEKVVARIRGWGAKKLSYAGRLVLIQAVLTQLHTYWTRIFIVPVTVIDRIEGVCRNYLWSGSEQYLRTPTVAWEKICREKKEGGLGIVNSRHWNTAMIAKYTGWLATKSDHLWIRWVDHIYMKGRGWFDYCPTANTSWTWRKICQVKDQVKLGFSNGIWTCTQGEYNVASGYKWLMGQQQPVLWYPLIWSKTIIPKHAFIGWLIVQERLLTKDRLLKFGVFNDGLCEFCQDQLEDHRHLLIEAKVPCPRWIIQKVKYDIQARCRDRAWALKIQKFPWEPSYD